MTIQFEGLQEMNKVPVSIIVFEFKTEKEKYYIGAVGNQTALDIEKYAQKEVSEIFKDFKKYLDKNKIKLLSRVKYYKSSDEDEIFEAYEEVEHILFEK